MSVTLSRSTLSVICLCCLAAGLSIGNAAHALERGYSPIAAVVSALLSLTVVLRLIATASREARERNDG
jgi:hypothetical protein